MKKLLSVIALLALLISANAAVSITSTVSTNTGVLTDPAVIQTLQVVTGTNVVLRLYDSDVSTNMVYVTGAYTNYVVYTTNYVNVYVDSTGTTNSHTNTTLYTSLQTVAAATNNITPFATYVIAANTTPTFTVNNTVLRGLCISNDIGCTFIVTSKTP